MKFTLKTKKNPFYGLRGSSSEQFVFVVIAFRLGVAVFVVLPSVSEHNENSHSKTEVINFEDELLEKRIAQHGKGFFFWF